MIIFFGNYKLKNNFTKYWINVKSIFLLCKNKFYANIF